MKADHEGFTAGVALSEAQMHLARALEYAEARLWMTAITQCTLTLSSISKAIEELIRCQVKRTAASYK